MKRVLALALTVVVAVLVDARPGATEPTYAFLTSAPNAIPQVGLNDSVRVKLSNDVPFDATKVKARLFVDGRPLEQLDKDGLSWEGDSRVLSFRLQRNQDNKAMWAQLIGEPFSHDRVRSLPIAVEVDGVPLKFAGGAASETIDFVSYHAGRVALALALAFLVVVVTVWLARTTSLMRDAVIPQIRLKDRSYSLGRLQMAIWFAIIFGVFLFVWAMTGDLDTITDETFILLGISGATALGAVIVDQQNSGPRADIEKRVVDLGLTNRALVEKLYELADANAAQSARPQIPAAQIGTNINPTVAQLKQAYENEIVELKSLGFFRDLVEDVNGPTIHRWQILAWTVVLGLIFLAGAYSGLELPKLGTNLLILMGISGGLYLGFKIPERQTA